MQDIPFIQINFGGRYEFHQNPGEVFKDEALDDIIGAQDTIMTIEKQNYNCTMPMRIYKRAYLSGIYVAVFETMRY